MAGPPRGPGGACSLRSGVASIFVRLPRLQCAVEGLLARTEEFRGYASTRWTKASEQPRGHPAWEPRLSKASLLYPELVNALSVAKEWQEGGADGE